MTYTQPLLSIIVLCWGVIDAFCHLIFLFQAQISYVFELHIISIYLDYTVLT